VQSEWWAQAKKRDISDGIGLLHRDAAPTVEHYETRCSKPKRSTEGVAPCWREMKRDETAEKE